MTELNYQKLQSFIEKESFNDIIQVVESIGPYMIRYVKDRNTFFTVQDIASGIYSLGMVSRLIRDCKPDSINPISPIHKESALQEALYLFSLQIEFVKSPVTTYRNLELLKTLNYIHEGTLRAINDIFGDSPNNMFRRQEDIQRIVDRIEEEISKVQKSSVVSPEEFREMTDPTKQIVETPVAPEFKDDDLKTVWEDVVNGKEVDLCLLEDVFDIIEDWKPHDNLSNAIAEFFIEYNLDMGGVRKRKLALDYIFLLNNFSTHAGDDSTVIAEANLNTLFKRITTDVC